MQKLKILGLVVAILTLVSFVVAQEDAALKPGLAENQVLQQEPPAAVAQEGPAVQTQEPEAKNEPAKEEVKEEALEWVWGDVVSVDAENKSFSVTYLDYEADSEKEIAFSIDEKTVFENVQDLTQLNPQDSVSVDYLVNNDGKNMARLVSAEKNIPQAIEGDVSE